MKNHHRPSPPERMNKMNCWEFMRCGREPGGIKTQELGICPVTMENRLDRINSGKNGGRTCWAVTGSLCGGNIQGTFANKLGNCQLCEFYKMVKDDEGEGWSNTKMILGILAR